MLRNSLVGYVYTKHFGTSKPSFLYGPKTQYTSQIINTSKQILKIMSYFDETWQSELNEL